MTAARLLDLVERIVGGGVRAWVDGGWCIDALLERQTRRHDDLDLVVARPDLPALWAVLREAGYEPAGEALNGDSGLEDLEYAVDARGHQVDVHPVSFTEAGEAVYTMPDGEPWTYPAHAFTGRGRVLGREVPCIAADEMLFCHSTGYALDAAHQADVTALAERFGLPVPHFTPADTSTLGSADEATGRR